MCNERRKQQMERWRELGGIVGLKEWQVRGGHSGLQAEVTVGEVNDAVDA
jgi:hypothetical protein